MTAFVVVMGLFAGVRNVMGIEVKRTATMAQQRGQRGEKTAMMVQQGGLKGERTATMVQQRGQRGERTATMAQQGGLRGERTATVVQQRGQRGERTATMAQQGGLRGHEGQRGHEGEREQREERKAHRVRGVWSYSECFPDSQSVQIVAAEMNGITPVRNREEAEKLVKRHELVNICHSPFYSVDKLTHSIPYLVPKAQHLLNTICLNFMDSCQVKGLPIHLPIVTSVLRTTEDVSNLQKGNKNATTNSCHCYGTTVDIAYNKFMPMTGTYESKATLLRWNEPMKQVLSEVLNDLRLEGKCYVKYERKQGCFHLTCR